MYTLKVNLAVITLAPDYIPNMSCRRNTALRPKTLSHLSTDQYIFTKRAENGPVMCHPKRVVPCAMLKGSCHLSY